MLKQKTSLTMLWGLLGGLAIAPVIAPVLPAKADLPITGGTINFQGTRIFVPCTCGSGTGDIYNGSANPIIIRTQLGTIQQNIRVNSGILPQLDLSGSGSDVTGQWLTTVNFRGLSPSGGTTFFLNIPATVNFTVSGSTPIGTGTTPFYRYSTDPVTFSETGVAVNASSVGGIQRLTPVVGVNYGSSETPPAEGFTFGSFQAPFNSDRTVEGTNYTADLNATITGGNLSTPPNDDV